MRQWLKKCFSESFQALFVHKIHVGNGRNPPFCKAENPPLTAVFHQQDTIRPTIPQVIIYHTNVIISIKKALEKTHKLSYFKPLSASRGVAQWLARLLWEQDVAGSTPATPTIFLPKKWSTKTQVFSSLRGAQLHSKNRVFSSHLHPAPISLACETAAFYCLIDGL